MAAQVCPSCGAPMVASARTCPACGGAYSQEYFGVAETIPQIPVTPARPAVETVPCPMCSEPIPRGSTRCKWCGENIGTGKPTGMGAQNYQPPPPPQAGAMPPPLAVQRPDPNPALIVSIIALAGGFFSCGFLHLLGPVAWMMANTYVNKCRAMGLEPEGSGTTAKILGIISTVFLILGLCGAAAYFGILMIAIGGAAASH